MTAIVAQEVTAKFDEKKKVEQAVELLAEHAISVDDIEIVLVDETGFHDRDLNIRTRSQSTRRIAMGVVLGALLGGAAPFLPTAGLLGFMGTGWLSPTSSAAAGTAVVGGGFGGALAALLELRHRRARVRVTEREAGRGSMLVTVRAADRVPVARRILREAGAEHVSG